MSGPATRAPLTALSATLLVQGLAALTLTVPSVLAPVVAAELGVPARSVGWLVSIAYLAAMIGSAAFAALVGLSGSYGAAFVALAAPPALAGVLLLVRRPS